MGPAVMHLCFLSLLPAPTVSADCSSLEVGAPLTSLSVNFTGGLPGATIAVYNQDTGSNVQLGGATGTTTPATVVVTFPAGTVAPHALSVDLRDTAGAFAEFKCHPVAPLAFAGPCPTLSAGGLPYTLRPSDVAFVANTGSGVLASCDVVSGGTGSFLGVRGGTCNPGTLSPDTSSANLVLQAVDSFGGIAILGGPGGCPKSGAPPPSQSLQISQLTRAAAVLQCSRSPPIVPTWRLALRSRRSPPTASGLWATRSLRDLTRMELFSPPPTEPRRRTPRTSRPSPQPQPFQPPGCSSQPPTRSAAQRPRRALCRPHSCQSQRHHPARHWKPAWPSNPPSLCLSTAGREGR